jgi:putative spermidine/putrescine transport system substrate-binding protein
MRITTCLFSLWLGSMALISEAGPLRVLAWPGYADPNIVATFEQKTGIKVEVTVIDTDDALWTSASANEGRNFDIMAVNTGELQRYIDAYLVQDIPEADVPNIQNQLPRFQHVPDVERAGKRYAVPFTYSEMGLIYDRKLVSPPPVSMAALWDPRYRGKIALYEGSNHNFSLTALAMGIQNPFELSPDQFRKVVHRLIDLRANRPLFYSSPDDAVALFRNHEVALMFGNYGSQQVQQLKKAGFDPGYVIPREGAIAWLDCWAILRGASDMAQATAFINYMTSADVGRQLTQRQGLPNTLQRQAGMRDQDKILWLQPVENNALRNQYWTRILTGAKKGAF